jgi:hypothetical protein
MSYPACCSERDLPVDHAARDLWMDEVVQLRPPSGRVRYLLYVRREPCDDCGTGVRMISVWGTSKGRGEVVAWCGHCFNAICEPIGLAEEYQERFDHVRAAASRTKSGQMWPAVRPALEDLERRGVL